MLWECRVRGSHIFALESGWDKLKETAVLLHSCPGCLAWIEKLAIYCHKRLVWIGPLVSQVFKPLIAILPQLLMFQFCMLMPAWNQCLITIGNRILAAMFWGQTEAEAAPLVCQNDSSQPIQTGSFLPDSRSLKFQDKVLCAWIELWGTSQVQSLLQWRPDFKETSARDVSRNMFFLKQRLKTLEFPSPEKEHQALQIAFSFGLPVLISGHLNPPLRLPLARSRVREHCLNWCFSRAAMQRGRAQHTTRANARQTVFYTTWQPEIGQDGIAQ